MASQIDQLFQLPLGEFTGARNALAKTAGKEGAAIRQLTKPPLAAWAINQLYWRDRDTYDALIEAANEMRRTHKAVIEGRKADLRTAGREHEIAIEGALKSTLAILKDSANPVTEATRQAILNTLRALPADEPAGRLTRALAPGGFEMLAGITPATAPKGAARSARAANASPKGSTKEAEAKTHQHEAARQREQRAAAERAVRDADQKARRAEFEAARASRDAAKAAKRIEEARKAVEEAQAELEAAEREADRAERENEAAARRARDANDALDAAKAKVTW